MRLLIVFLTFVSALVAQSLNLSMAAGTSGPLVTVTFADATPSANVAGLQFTLTLPAGVTAAAPIAGTASASKLITCAGLVCVDVGDGATLNATPFASGPLMSFQLSGSPTSSPGTIALSNVLGATSVNASTVNLTTNTLTMSKYDLNSDGLVNATDVQVAVAAYQAVQAGGVCSGLVAALGDGKCDVTAIVTEILAALGVIH